MPLAWTVVGVALALALGVGGTLAVQQLTGHDAATTPRPATSTAVSTFAVSGNLTLADYMPAAGDLGVPCQGIGGYDDIQGGAQVVIYDATGRQLAVGALNQGEILGLGRCVFAFRLSGVPRGDGGPYSVEVSHRGKIAFTFAQAYDVEMSLG